MPPRHEQVNGALQWRDDLLSNEGNEELGIVAGGPFRGSLRSVLRTKPFKHLTQSHGKLGRVPLTKN